MVRTARLGGQGEDSVSLTIIMSKNKITAETIPSIFYQNNTTYPPCGQHVKNESMGFNNKVNNKP